MSHGKFAGALALIMLTLGVAAAGAPGNALFKAAASGDIAKVKALIAAGADVNYTNPSDGMTPLMAAAEYDNYEIVEVLLAAHADAAKKDHNGATAMTWAGRGNYLDSIRPLTEATDKSHPGSVVSYACKAAPDDRKPPLLFSVHAAAGSVSVQWTYRDGSYASPEFFQADIKGAKVEWYTGIHGGSYIFDRATGRLDWNLGGSYSYALTTGHLNGKTEKDFSGVMQCRRTG